MRLPSRPSRPIARASAVITAAAPAVAVLAAVASLLIGAPTAWSQSSMPAGSPGRFSMYPVEGGVIRMDTETGSLSMCKQAGGSWTCALLPDDRKALADENARLQSENSELKASVRRLEELAGTPGQPGAAPDTNRHGGIQLPSEEDVDKAMSYVERMLKKFKDKLRELEKSDDKPAQKL